MPRKLAVIPPRAPERAKKASIRAILESPLWPQADALGGPWDLTKRLFDQHRMVRHIQGDFGADVALARDLYLGQLTFTAGLFYQGDRRIQAHWPDVVNLREFLDIKLEKSVGVFSHRTVVILSPRGKPLGAEKMTPEDFVELDASARADWRLEHDGQEPKDVDMWVALGLSRARYYRLKARGELLRPPLSAGRV